MILTIKYPGMSDTFIPWMREEDIEQCLDDAIPGDSLSMASVKPDSDIM